MANLSKTRTLFAWTSPRTIEKIIPEIDLLIAKFSGKVWSGNSKLQADFYKALVNSDFFEEQAQNNNHDFAARDRITRAPKALGFVDLKPIIKLTSVGEQLLSGSRTNEVIARQLFKFQLPSPYHPVPEDRNFNVKPYLELLRLVKEVGNLSKTEIAIFFLQLTNYKKFPAIVNSILKFRKDIQKYKGNRKEFIDRVFTKEILKVYSDEIKSKNFKTRESKENTLDNFVYTKKRNHIDYADAFIRYLRASQYISLDKKTFRIILAPSRLNEIDYVLKNVSRNAGNFSEAEYKKYLFNPSSLLLLTDDRKYLEDKLIKIGKKPAPGLSIQKLKDLYETTEIKLVRQAKQEVVDSLKNYREFDDVLNVFDKINNREISDAPLYLEWNIWRALVMINYAKDIKGNFKLDLDGLPLNTALGNLPDIEAEYEGFKLIVEVTMSSGNKQYEMEGEPVARHFGNMQRNSKEPVYCLFIAPKISEGALAHFFNLNRFNTKAYGGKTRIIPMSLAHFISFITVAKEKKFNKSDLLKRYFERVIEYNLRMEDEVIWSDQINKSIATWVN